MKNELKYAMQRWFNVSHDIDYLPFDSYFEMAVRKKDVEQFSIRFFRHLAQHADKAEALLIGELNTNQALTEQLTKMTDSAINRPVVLKTMEDADVIEQRQHFNKAIELLEACSEDLFLGFGDDAELEHRVDEFIKEVKS